LLKRLEDRDMQPHDLWERYMGCYDYLMGVQSYVAGLREIATAAQLHPGYRVLDAGSGTGNLSLLLKEQGAGVVSCDFSAAALECHRRKDPHADLVRASLEERLPFDDSGFHAVYCASVLFALSRTGCASAVREFFRVLSPGGRLVVTVAAPEKRNGHLVRTHLRSMVRECGVFAGTLRFLARLPNLLRVLHYNRRLQQLPDWQGYHRFTEDELRSLLSGAGFAALQVRRTYAGSFFLVECVKPFDVVAPQAPFLQNTHGIKRDVLSA
jgi:ubiquinone/menaquinone biosynthesis C-methylase UbiE